MVELMLIGTNVQIDQITEKTTYPWTMLAGRTVSGDRADRANSGSSLFI